MHLTSLQKNDEVFPLRNKFSCIFTRNSLISLNKLLTRILWKRTDYWPENKNHYEKSKVSQWKTNLSLANPKRVSLMKMNVESDGKERKNWKKGRHYAGREDLKNTARNSTTNMNWMKKTKGLFVFLLKVPILKVEKTTLFSNTDGRRIKKSKRWKFNQKNIFLAENLLTS